MKPKKVYIVRIGNNVVYCSTNLKAAYLQMAHSMLYDDASALKSYEQVTRIMLRSKEFVHTGKYILSYSIVLLPLHTKHSKIGISA